jgi:hypothetical protein
MKDSCLNTTDLVSYKSVKRESLFHQRVSSDRERDIPLIL